MFRHVTGLAGGDELRLASFIQVGVDDVVVSHAVTDHDDDVLRGFRVGISESRGDGGTSKDRQEQNPSGSTAYDLLRHVTYFHSYTQFCEQHCSHRLVNDDQS